MRDTKLLETFKKRIEKELKEKNIFKMLRKEGKPQKQSVAIALNTYPKATVKPLANKY